METQQSEQIDTQLSPEAELEQLGQQLHDSFRAERDSADPQPGSPDRDSESSQTDSDTETLSDSPETAGADTPEYLLMDKLAEALGVEQDELWQTLGFKMQDGSTMSASELKNRFQDVQRSEELLAKAQTARSEHEAEMMRQNQAMLLARQRTGVEVTDQDLEAARIMAEQFTDQQNQVLGGMIPEYKDPATRGDVEGLINKRMDAMGIPEPLRPNYIDAYTRASFYQHQRLLDEIASVSHKRAEPKRKQKPGKHVTSSRLQQIMTSKPESEADRQAALAELGRNL